MNTISISEKNYTTPSSWNEMTLTQQLECYNILTSGVGSIFSPQEVVATKRIALVCRLLSLQDTDMTAWRLDCIRAHGIEDGHLIFLEELSAVLAISDYLFDITEDADGNQLFSVKLGLTRCPWPALQMSKTKGSKKKVYHAPADELENITLYELALTFTLFEQYLESNDIKIADELLATLYRPSKPSTPYNKRSGYEGDRRLPIYKHEAMVKKRKARFASLPIATKRLMLFWFASCRQHIVDQYPNLFNTHDDGLERVGNDYGWGGMLLALAGGIVHLDQINQEPYQNGLVYLSYLEDQRKLAERNRRSA